MSYLAYLCYRQTYDEELIDENVEVCFSELERYRYSKIVPITFTPLTSWSEADATLYTK